MTNIKRFIAKVVNVNDPEKAGRAQIRVFGDHDDHARIPDSDLPWARCVFPVTHGMSGGVSGATTGLVVGSIVRGEWVDPFEVIPVIDGTLGRSTAEDGGNGDFSPQTKGDDLNSVLSKNLIGETTEKLQYRNLDSIGPLDPTKKISPFNKLKNALKTVKELRDLLKNANISELNAIINGSKTADGGTTYTTANQNVSSIAQKLSKENITSIAQAINRINGSKFQMNTTMSAVEDALKSLKA